MATRQYIGARYVPKFYQNSVDGSTQWQSNVVYEPLTWVTLQNGHMYISKKQVPATVGTPAENVDYWLDIGDYNGFIEDLDERVTANEQAISALQDDVEVLVDDVYICISDSYGATYGNTPGDTHTFFDYLRTALGRNSTNLLSYAYGGAGFVKSYEGTFLQHFTADSALISAEVKNKVTKIVVAAGRNDYEYTFSDIKTAIGNFVTYCKTNYPNAKVYLAFIANGVNNVNGTKAQQLNVYYAYADCSLLGAYYLSGCEAILRRPDLMNSDSVHPNSDGIAQIGKFLGEAIVTGAAHVCYAPVTCALDNNSKWEYVDLATIPITTYMNDGMVTIDFPQITSIHFTQAITVDTGTDITLGGYSGNKNFYGLSKKFFVPCRLDIKTSSGDPAEKISGALYINEQGFLKLRMFEQPTATQIQDIIVMAQGSICAPAVLC